MISPEYITSEDKLSKHSLQVDGSWLEMVLPRFRIISASGLTPLSPDYNVEDYTSDDGGNLTQYRYPTREITIGFVCEIDDYYASISKKEEIIGKVKNDGSISKLIFNDDVTTYYEGFYSACEFAEPYWDGDSYCITGTITFVCPYPHKRSVTDKTFTMEVKSTDAGMTYQEVEVNNEGTLPAPVSFTISTPKESLSYVTLVGEEQAYEIGNSSAEEGKYKESESVMTLTDLISASNTTENILWNHLGLRNEYWHTGTWSTRDVISHKWLYLSDSDASSGLSEGRYGNCKEFTFSDSLDNFQLESRLWIQESSAYQAGYITIAFIDTDGNVVMGLELYNATLQGESTIKWYVNGEVIKTFKFRRDGGSSAPFTNYAGYFCLRRDTLTKFSFYYKSKWYSTVDTSLKNTLIAKVQYGSYQRRGDSKPLAFWTRRDVALFNVWKLAASSTAIADRFREGDEIDINAESAMISVNGTKRNDVEVIGSKTIMAPSGKSIIKAYYSPRLINCDPTITARITERWY